MFDELFTILDDDYRLENISLIAENLDNILKLTSQRFLKDNFKQDQAIEAVIQLLLTYKTFEKVAPPEKYKERSCCF